MKQSASRILGCWWGILFLCGGCSLQGGSRCVNCGPDANVADSNSGDSDSALLDSSVTQDAVPDPCAQCEEACVNGACCPFAQACDGACCGQGEVCSFRRCVPPGNRCSGSEECGSGEYCEPGVTTSVDPNECSSRASGTCLPLPPRCEAGTLPDEARPECVAQCTFLPPSGTLGIRERYRWNVPFSRMGTNAYPSDARNAPIVINLDDDDCDGAITGRDIPEVIVTVSPNDSLRSGGQAVGNIIVLSVSDGELREKWRVDNAGHPWTYLAAGNIDGQPGNEIVTCSPDRLHMRAYAVTATADGLTLRWESPQLPTGLPCTMPSLADLDQDGDVEILIESAVLNGQTGAIERTFDVVPTGHVIASDVDNDPLHTLEVVSGQRVYALSGPSSLVTTHNSGIAGTHVLTTQLDGTGVPEIVSINTPNHRMSVWRINGSAVEIVRQGLDINGPLDPTRCGASTPGRTTGGGPPTAADVNNDGIPDIAVAGGVGYVVIDGARIVNPEVPTGNDLLLWTSATEDCSSAQTGSSVFDFNADGRAEVLYGDEYHFRIYAGDTGEVLFETCNTNGTILEHPIVADIDNNGEADIIVAGNAIYRECDGSRQSGISVFSSQSGDWVRTRRIWNQHAYHITNAGEDGNIPAREAPNWNDPQLNNYRLNRQPGNELAAADAVLRLAPVCTSPAGVIATVTNLGEAVLPRGVVITLYLGDPEQSISEATAVATAETALDLYPAQSEAVSISLSPTDANTLLMSDGVTGFGALTTTTLQCRSQNDTANLPVCRLL